MKRFLRWRVLAVLVVLFGASASSWAEGGAHSDPVTPLALSLAVVLLGAKLGGELATRLKQPAVLGELLAGVLLGNLDLFGLTALVPLKTDLGLDLLARLGVLLLLFEVGLESTVNQMMKVGWSSLLVAVLGVIAPFALGYGVGALLLPEESVYVHVFLGATLTATSVGITARVLKDLNVAQSAEARIILGAAVLDDVLGLVILAVVSGIISAADSGGALSLVEVGIIFGKAAGFLVGALFLGAKLTPLVFRRAARFQSKGVLLAAGLSFCFLLSYLSAVIGLAPIVGAFAAGLILEEVHYRDFTDRGERGLEDLVHPISAFLVPIFFVLMGMRTEISAFLSPSSAGLAAGLLVVAIAGKQVCGLGVLGPGIDRVTVGVGMIPRGEVGLIFASIGRELVIGGQPVISSAVFSAVVVVVIVTTLVTPPGLQWAFRRRAASSSEQTIK